MNSRLHLNVHVRDKPLMFIVCSKLVFRRSTTREQELPSAVPPKQFSDGMDPCDSILYVVRLEESISLSKNAAKKYCLFVVSASTPTDCNHESMKDGLSNATCKWWSLKFWDRTSWWLLGRSTHDLTDRAIWKPFWATIMDYLFCVVMVMEVAYFSCSMQTSTCMYLSGTNFHHNGAQLANCCSPSAEQRRKQINQTASSYRWGDE